MGNISIEKLNELADKLLGKAFIVEDLGRQLHAVLHEKKEETLTGVMNDFREYGDDYSETIIRLYRLHSFLFRLGIKYTEFDSVAYVMYELLDDADYAKKMPYDLIYIMANMSEYIARCKGMWEEELKAE